MGEARARWVQGKANLMTFYLFKGSVTLYTGLGDDDVTVKQGQVFGEDAMLVRSGNFQVTAVTKEHTTAVVRPSLPLIRFHSQHFQRSPLCSLRSITRLMPAGVAARRCCTRSTWRRRCTWASASGRCICQTTHASR